ncbi:MAG: hypothetical protein WA705_03335 [Candidatus Ozemobacteraceae bacterium]
MANGTIEISFSGKDFGPESVHSRDLGKIIATVEEMILSAVKQKVGINLPDNFSVSLVGMRKGSIKLTFASATTALAIAAFCMVAETVNGGSLATASRSTANGLQEISSFARKYNCKAEFIRPRCKKRVIATITPKTVLEGVNPIVGPTNIYGRVVRVGGKRPTVTIETTDGKTLTCDSNKEIARQLGKKLYSVVGLRGMAKWHPYDMDLIDFTIEGIEDYEECDIVDAFAELAKIASPHFDAIEDPDAYVRELRGQG